MALRLHVTNDTDRSMRRGAAAAALGILLCSAPASAQLDPLLFVKTTAPNVILVVDTANRMQRDAPDPNTGKSNYYDPAIYNKDLTKLYQTNTLGISNGNTAAFYRRKYTEFTLGVAGTFTTSTIQITHDLDDAAFPSSKPYTRFEAPTRMSIARAAL